MIPYKTDKTDTNSRSQNSGRRVFTGKGQERTFWGARKGTISWSRWQLHRYVMNLKRITEKSHTEKSAYSMISFMWHFGKGKTTGVENKSVVARSLWWKEIDRKEAQGTLGDDGNGLYLDCGGVTQQDTVIKSHWSVHFKRLTLIITKL